jgi:MoxR-like ATPase
MLSADLDGTAAEQLGVRRSVVEGLALKTLFYLGEATVQELAERMHIAPYIVEGIFQRLKKDMLMQATGLSDGGHRVNLTSAGRTRATELLSIDQYVGPTPVSLADYVERLKSQTVRDIVVHPPDVAEAFRDLVLDDGILSQIGTAIISGRAIFLYGPPGTGKTTIAEKMSEIFRKETVWIPYAVEIDGQMITVFDDHVHERVEGAGGLHGDTRWVRCRRPRLMVGGELTIDMLDLEFNPISKVYTAPVQMRANNGFLIIDDFGRQRIPPADLLNRWVVPLDRRVDFLTMTGGRKLQIPFDLFVVFATNLDPASVIEEAFLRRIQTKINMGKLTSQQFHEIFKRACTSSSLKYDKDLVDDVMKRIVDEFEQPLRACQPQDLINQILWRAKYEQTQPAFDVQGLAAACRAYFLTKPEP